MGGWEDCERERRSVGEALQETGKERHPRGVDWWLWAAGVRPCAQEQVESRIMHQRRTHQRRPVAVVESGLPCRGGFPRVQLREGYPVLGVARG